MAYTKLPQEQEKTLSRSLFTKRYIGESSYFHDIARQAYKLVKDSPLNSIKTINFNYIESLLGHNRTDYTFSVQNKNDRFNEFLSVFIGLPINTYDQSVQLIKATNNQISSEAISFITRLTEGKNFIFAPIVTVRENFKFKYIYMRPVIKDAIKVLSKEKATLVAVLDESDFELFADLVKECCVSDNIKANVLGQSIERVFNKPMCIAVIDFS